MGGDLPSAPWERALATFVDRVGVRLRWMLVGSAATAVHGAVVTPGDVDILVHPDTPDDTMARGLAPLNAFAGEAARAVASDGLATFASTREYPLLATANGRWLFGRWSVWSCVVEVARIREPVSPHVLLETEGSTVWDFRDEADWRGRLVPIVPLEVQLATTVARGLAGRELAILAQLRLNGVRASILERSFRDRGLDVTRPRAIASLPESTGQ
jgi:hypothetical protein